MSVAGDAPLAAGDCPLGSSLLPIMTSIASLIGCFYVVGTYWYVPALRQHPAGIMFGMSVYGGIYQFLYLLDQSAASVQCSQMGMFVDFFLTGQETYMLIFAIDLLLALKNPFSASKGQMTKYHICGGVWSLVCATISHFDTRYALFSFCWANSSGEILDGSHDVDGGKAGTAANGTLTAGIFFAVYIVVVYCTSLIAIVRTWNTFMKGLRDTFRTRQRIQRHLKYYVGCYFGYWTLVLACYALFSILPHTTTTDADGNSDGGVRCRVWHLLSCLLLAKGMVNALIWTRTSNILKIIEQLREFGYVDLPAHEDSINWALRLEILTNTTKGICESVDRAERQARVSASASASSSMAEASGAVDLTSDNCWNRRELYTQTEEIILENRNDSSSHGPRSEGVVFYDYAPHVFRRLRMEAKVSSASYRHSLQQTTKERVSEGKSGAFFYFTEDRKYVVKTLTNDELRFLLSILQTYFEFMGENPNTFMTRFFGCHGLTMYGKTVFFVVMQSVFDTGLQIHERFDLKGSWVGRLEGRKPSGTVATCKFCSAEFTVGGSHDQRCDVRRGEGNLRHQYDQVGKDLNWNRHMALPPSTARAVAQQLIRDSDFLCSVNCIDYSLLVGIHHRSFNVSHYSSAESVDLPSRGSCSDASFLSNASSSGGGSSTAAGNGCYRTSGSADSSTKAVYNSHARGMSVDEVHGPGIYFLGLIDMLQEWNLRKRVEHFVRVTVLLQDRHGISVVSPRQYAERFQRRVVRELIYDRGAHEAHMALGAEDVTLTQLQLQDQRNTQLLLESGRTMSTLLASLESNQFVSSPVMMEHSPTLISPARSPGIMLPAPLSNRSTCIHPRPHSFRMIPPPVSRRRAATTASVASVAPTWDFGPGRLSGGLVMEMPWVRSSLHQQPPQSQQPQSHHQRRLAALHSSPRVSNTYSLGRNDSADSMKAQAESSASTPPALPPGTAAITIPESLAASSAELHHDYRIVCTPTFPDKGNATLSA